MRPRTAPALVAALFFLVLLWPTEPPKSSAAALTQSPAPSFPAPILAAANGTAPRAAVPSEPTWSDNHSNGRERSSISPDQMVGNVEGTVRDADTLEPIPNADIYLLEEPVQKTGAGESLHTNRGEIDIPDLRRALMRGTTDGTGHFLIRAVPTPFPLKTYTIVIVAPGYGYFIADGARVLPGAVMSLEVDAVLRKDMHLLVEPDDPDAPFKYRHEMETPNLLPERSPTAPSADGIVTYTVYATREGLVGHTTANGHVIRSNDRFVALPSFRVLNANDQTYDFQVRLTYAGKSVDAPVWDIGPWNIADDYWNPSSIRQTWPDLAQGLPEAQAAYQSGYNGGHNYDGRVVTSPTAIDLADGTFWQDLGLTTSTWLPVRFLWKPDVAVGTRVYAAADVAVRATPGGNQTAVEPCGATGEIQSGPTGATFDQVFTVWWDIQWGNGARGWSAENRLTRTPACGPRYYFPFIAK